ncbi:kinesin [Novymonas esmeraldas]|uniref:Kinesin n=1 Tax=Novymonas esmeraldas TaxID=1808958 RepID=A0AAW0FA44_9TRYP
MTERVRVAVRIRPFIASDPADAELNTLVIDPTHVSVGHRHVFKVDRVYMMEDTTAQVYAVSVAPLVSRFISGTNACVLAYGQTGTGKTFTVRSLLPLLLRDILADATAAAAAAPAPAAAATAAAPLLYLQYVEVYGETIRDLLVELPTTPPGPHGEAAAKVRLVATNAATAGAAAAATGCTLVGATVAPIATAEQAASLIARGEARRATGATAVHANSSRSHAVLTLHHARLACRFDVVDLAGSEREKKTRNVGVRLQESIAINTALLALGAVIRALSRAHKSNTAKEAAALREGGGGGGGGGEDEEEQQRRQRTPHIPYRSSTLTRLLQDTLGGTSATLFIACVAPDTHNKDETLRTLHYCALALRVLNTPLQQQERRLRRDQSPPLGHRRGGSASHAVSPLSLRGGGDGDDGDVTAAEDAATSQAAQLLELQYTYADLQQQYDERGAALASIGAAYATVRERLTLCERELRADEDVFAQQIRATHALLCENQKLRRRLSKAASHRRQPSTSPAPVDTRTRDLDLDDNDGDGGGGSDSAPIDVLRRRLIAGARGAVDGLAAAAAAAHPPRSTHSPHRLKNSGAERNDTPQAGVRARRGGGAAVVVDTTPPLLLPPAAAATTEGSASASLAAAPVQSFIEYLLGLHGIATAAAPAAAPATAATARALALSAATASSLSSVRHSGAVSAAAGGGGGRGHDGGAAAQIAEEPTSTPCDVAVSASAAGDALRRGGLSSPDDGGGAVVQLATEVLRHRNITAELQHEVRRLQAELDGTQRESALLRLELKELKELFTA